MGILDAFLVCIITYISELRGYALSKKQAEYAHLRDVYKRQVQDVANVVKFLCSEDSTYITGQVIAVDGGMVM